MISVEIKIKEAINELKQITPPARPCLFKICAETSDSSLWKRNLPVFILHVTNMLILRLTNSINSFTVVSSLFFPLKGNNSTEAKVIFLYVGCQLIPKALTIIIHLFFIVWILSTCIDSSLRPILPFGIVAYAFRFLWTTFPETAGYQSNFT